MRCGGAPLALLPRAQRTAQSYPASRRRPEPKCGRGTPAAGREMELTSIKSLELQVSRKKHVFWLDPKFNARSNKYETCGFGSKCGNASNKCIPFGLFWPFWLPFKQSLRSWQIREKRGVEVEGASWTHNLPHRGTKPRGPSPIIACFLFLWAGFLRQFCSQEPYNQ